MRGHVTQAKDHAPANVVDRWNSDWEAQVGGQSTHKAKKRRKASVAGREAVDASAAAEHVAASPAPGDSGAVAAASDNDDPLGLFSLLYEEGEASPAAAVGSHTEVQEEESSPAAAVNDPYIGRASRGGFPTTMFASSMIIIRMLRQ